MGEKKYNYVYKITNNLNSMEYVGVHSTDNINDNYFGSGTYLNFAIKKYGKVNFTKQIIKECDSKYDALQLEKKIVSEKYIQRRNVYNLVTGGGYPFQRKLTIRKFNNSMMSQLAIDFNNPVKNCDNYIADIPKDKRLIFYTDEKAIEELLVKWAESYHQDFKDLRVKISRIFVNQLSGFAKNLTLCYNNSLYNERAKSVISSLTERGLIGTGIKYKAA